MPSLTSIIPVVRSYPCAGTIVKVAEFRIRDLAELQAILDGLTPDPWEAIRDEIAAGPAPQRRAELVGDAWERAERGPSQVGTPDGNAYFCTPEGASLVLWLATRRHTPGMTPELAADLFSRAAPAEIRVIWRAAYGISALSAMEEHAFAPDVLAAVRPGVGPEISWPEAIDALSRERNWTYDYIFGMTISEFSSARRHGKPREFGVTLSPGQPWGAIAEAQSRWFGGASPSPDVGIEPGSTRPRPDGDPP